MINLGSVAESAKITNSIFFIEEALFYRNYEVAIKLFSDFWSFEDELPEWNEYELPVKAKFLQVAGELLLDYGKSQNIPNFQERAKDALTRAIDLYLSIENVSEAMNCRRLQAVCYFHEGSINEYQILLEDAESYFTDKTNNIYLLIQANFILLLIKQKKIREAIIRIERNLEFVDRCGDLKTLVMFYTQSGIVYRQNCEYEKSLLFYQKALFQAKSIKHTYFEALITNSLATNLCYLERFQEALIAVDNAIKLAQDFPGWKANFLDTKANIYLKQKDYDVALEYADESIEIFQQGDDTAGLCESLWTKTKILIQQNYGYLAFSSFIELYQLTKHYDSSETAQKYLKDFSQMVFCIPDEDFNTQINLFKRHLVEEALEKATGVTKAAKKLGINHKRLSAMISNEFPDLYDDFDIKRQTRSDKKMTDKNTNYFYE